MMCTVRSCVDNTSMQKAIQVWLLNMQHTKPTHVADLKVKCGFKTKDFLEDVLDLLKVTKDPRTCE